MEIETDQNVYIINNIESIRCLPWCLSKDKMRTLDEIEKCVQKKYLLEANMEIFNVNCNADNQYG